MRGNAVSVISISIALSFVLVARVDSSGYQLEGAERPRCAGLQETQCADPMGNDQEMILVQPNSRMTNGPYLEVSPAQIFGWYCDPWKPLPLPNPAPFGFKRKISGTTEFEYVSASANHDAYYVSLDEVNGRIARLRLYTLKAFGRDFVPVHPFDASYFDDVVEMYSRGIAGLSLRRDPNAYWDLHEKHSVSHNGVTIELFEDVDHFGGQLIQFSPAVNDTRVGGDYNGFSSSNLVNAGTFSDGTALGLLFGNYDKDSRSAVWENLIVGSRPDLVNFAGVTKGVVTVAFDGQFLLGGVEKHFIITTTKPAGETYDGHASRLLLGGAIFSKKDNRWSIESQEKYLTLGPGWGGPPAVKLIQTGPAKYGVALGESDMAQGFESEGVSFAVPVKDKIKIVLSLAIRQDPNDDICSGIRGAGDSCIHFTTEYRFVAGSNADYFDVVTSKHIRNRSAPSGSTVTTRFTFISDKYVLARTP